MSKRVVIISTSIREGSNSLVLAKQVEKGAQSSGHSVELISLKDKNIQYCRGCLACQKIKKCVISDDALEITSKIKEADVIVWATPVYYYEMSGQMKTLIDRANSLYATGHRFSEVYVVTTSTESGDRVIKGVLSGVQGWIDCFSNVRLCGYVNGGGVDKPGAVNERKDLLEQAYNLGKNI